MKAALSQGKIFLPAFAAFGRHSWLGTSINFYRSIKMWPTDDECHREASANHKARLEIDLDRLALNKCIAPCVKNNIEGKRTFRFGAAKIEPKACQ